MGWRDSEQDIREALYLIAWESLQGKEERGRVNKRWRARNMSLLLPSPQLSSEEGSLVRGTGKPKAEGRFSCFLFWSLVGRPKCMATFTIVGLLSEGGQGGGAGVGAWIRWPSGEGRWSLALLIANVLLPRLTMVSGGDPPGDGPSGDRWGPWMRWRAWGKDQQTHQVLTRTRE